MLGLPRRRNVRWTIRNPTVASLVLFTAIFVALLVVPENPAGVIFSRAAYVPLVAVFLSLVKSDLLPRGWVLVGLSRWASLEVYLCGATLVALILDYPLIASAIIGRAIPAHAENRRALMVKLVAVATVLFDAGLLLGYLFVAKFWLISQIRFFQLPSTNPEIGGADFYFQVFESLLVVGAAFMVPVYAIVRRVRSRAPL